MLTSIKTHLCRYGYTQRQDSWSGGVRRRVWALLIPGSGCATDTRSSISKQHGCYSYSIFSPKTDTLCVPCTTYNYKRLLQHQWSISMIDGALNSVRLPPLSTWEDGLDESNSNSTSQTLKRNSSVGISKLMIITPSSSLGEITPPAHCDRLQSHKAPLIEESPIYIPIERLSLLCNITPRAHVTETCANC